MATATQPETRETRVSPDPKSYSCPQCEHVLRVSGLGRHRVYFDQPDGQAENAVINRVCPECGHGLPGKNRA